MFDLLGGLVYLGQIYLVGVFSFFVGETGILYDMKALLLCG